MKKEEFLIALEDILQRDDACAETDLLADYDEWDSLSKMATMAYFDKNFGVKLTLADMKELKSVVDLINFAGGKID